MDVNLLGFVKFAIPTSLEQAIQIISIIVQFLAIVASGLYWVADQRCKTE